MDKTPNCPICRKPLPAGPEHVRHRPFCSKRCADLDLSRWLHGTYAIPAVETDDDEDGGEDGEGGSGEGPPGPPSRARH